MFEETSWRKFSRISSFTFTSNPVTKSRRTRLPRHSQGLYLVQRIRDEAHRFAITAHRKRRSKQGLASQLDVVPGIGPTRRKALLKQFGSIDKIKAASIEELKTVVPQNTAEALKAYLD